MSHALYRENEILIATPGQKEIVPPGFIDESLFVPEKLLTPPRKRFGIVDLWKIQGRKRYGSIYGRRMY